MVPKIETQGTPARTGFHDKVYSNKTNLCNLPDRKFSRRS